MNQGYADVSYQTTNELAQQQAAQTFATYEYYWTSKRFKQVTLADIALDDVQRIKPYQALVDFITNFPRKKDFIFMEIFGVGKSFMLAAMANELAKKEFQTTLLHYPTFISDLDFDNAKVWVNEIKASQVLVLDDIGAEQNNAWVRDSILQVILQHRMQENLPTFFTSNLRMEELEQHLAETKRADEIWPAKRVMERVKYLAEEMRLEGTNRRHD